MWFICFLNFDNKLGKLCFFFEVKDDDLNLIFKSILQNFGYYFSWSFLTIIIIFSFILNLKCKMFQNILPLYVLLYCISNINFLFVANIFFIIFLKCFFFKQPHLMEFLNVLTSVYKFKYFFAGL